jgi:hypothetical protein
MLTDVPDRSSFRPPRPTRQKNVRQKNEEDQTRSLFFCLTFFCLVADTLSCDRLLPFMSAHLFRRDAEGFDLIFQYC